MHTDQLFQRPTLSDFSNGPTPIRLHVIDDSARYKGLRAGPQRRKLWSQDVPDPLAGWKREINGETYHLLCGGRLGEPKERREPQDIGTLYDLASGFVLLGGCDDLVVLDRGPRFQEDHRYLLYGRKRDEGE